jgi:LysM repeat protein
MGSVGMVREREETSGRQPWGARLLAPAAFFTAVTVLVLVVQSSLSQETQNSSPGVAATNTLTEETATGSATTTTTTTTTTTGPGGRRFYRIQSGDTLEAIALRFDTTVDDLLQLNPGIDANALTPGQRIRIR